jgi:hypothetical protein
MTKPQVASYGSWKSPFTSDIIASGTFRLEQVVLDRNDIYWIEMRPSEGGRCVIMRRNTEGHISEIAPSPINARTCGSSYGCWSEQDWQYRYNSGEC